MTSYIDLQTGRHTLEEHYEVVEKLKNEGFIFTYSSYGNPCFYNPKTKDDVCILASISDGSGYFTP